MISEQKRKELQEEFDKLCDVCDKFYEKSRGWRIILFPFYSRAWDKTLKRMREIHTETLQLRDKQ